MNEAGVGVVLGEELGSERAGPHEVLRLNDDPAFRHECVAAAGVHEA